MKTLLLFIAISSFFCGLVQADYSLENSSIDVRPSIGGRVDIQIPPRRNYEREPYYHRRHRRIFPVVARPANCEHYTEITSINGVEIRRSQRNCFRDRRWDFDPPHYEYEELPEIETDSPISFKIEGPSFRKIVDLLDLSFSSSRN